jgi:hypothetical protein
VQECAERPDIAALVVSFLEDFGRDVVGSSEYFVGAVEDELLLHAVLPVIGESEVDEDDVVVAAAAEEEVLGLEVPVADLLEVQVLDGLDHLAEDLLGLLLGQLAHLIQPVEQLAALAQTRSEA